MFSKRDADLKVEIKWALKTIASSFAASSCDGVANIFRTKFLGAGLEGFSLNKKKNDVLVDRCNSSIF